MLFNIYSTNHRICHYCLVPVHSLQHSFCWNDPMKGSQICFNDFSRLSSISTMLELLGLDTLKKQRDQLTLIMLFKMINNFVEIPYSHILVDSHSFTRSTASKFTHLYARLIHINFLFFHKQLDFGTLCHITQSDQILLTLLNI